MVAGAHADQLVAAVEELEADGHKACFKPASGAGGVGFRVITRAPFSLSHLNGFPSPYVPLDLVVEALQADTEGEEPVDWLVMPRLEQPEVSVDCLTGPDNRIRLAIGRTKNGRRRGFTLAEQWLEPARRIAEGFGLHYLSNIQFRMFGGRAGPDGRQHAPGGRAAPAGAVRGERPLGGCAVGARRGPGRDRAAVPGPGLHGGVGARASCGRCRSPQQRAEVHDPLPAVPAPVPQQAEPVTAETDATASATLPRLPLRPSHRPSRRAFRTTSPTSPAAARPRLRRHG